MFSMGPFYLQIEFDSLLFSLRTVSFLCGLVLLCRGMNGVINCVTQKSASTCCVMSPSLAPNVPTHRHAIFIFFLTIPDSIPSNASLSRFIDCTLKAFLHT